MTEIQTAAGAFAELRQLFGENRAEWSPERFSELFVAPPYFQKLETMRPCFLVGGRGTGKTTALRSLRFDATLQRIEARGGTFGEQLHLGVFVRMNKNQTLAFRGGTLDADEWRKAFAHYFNLVACVELTELTLWLEGRTGESLPETATATICRNLGLSHVATAAQLRDAIKNAIIDLELFVNNPKHSERPRFSMPEKPLREFALALNQADSLSQGRIIFCCIDEYENLLPHQQATLNTYIKHAEPPLSYKIGVRKNGLKTAATVEGADPLRVPDDYEQIDIAQEGFEYFAKAVADLRLNRAKEKGVPVPESLDAFLQDMTFAEEASALGADAVAAKVLEELADEPELRQAFDHRPPAETYFLRYWSESEQKDVKTLARHWLDHEDMWRNRLNNYGYASLFWLSKGHKGKRIRKYYCGSRTFLALPAGNIRYFLELVDSAIAQELDDPGEQLKKQVSVAPKSQTKAAKLVAQRRLDQLDGEGERGVELKRLVLAVGKVFFELARQPIGHSPEVTSFVVEGEGASLERIRSLLRDGVAYLAFEAAPRTKATTNNEIRDDEYRLHPIFCAFFEISHRRKRRTTFRADELLLLFERPSKAISRLLNDQGQSDEADLPEQLALFSSFFQGGADK